MIPIGAERSSLAVFLNRAGLGAVLKRSRLCASIVKACKDNCQYRNDGPGAYGYSDGYVPGH